MPPQAMKKTMKQIACAAVLVVACVPVWALAEDSKPEMKAAEVKKPKANKPQEQANSDEKAKSDDKKEKMPVATKPAATSPWDIGFGAAML